MFVVYLLVGLVWSGPGRCQFTEIGPYSSEGLAREKNRYTQGHLSVKKIEVPEWFLDLVKDAEGSSYLLRCLKGGV